MMQVRWKTYNAWQKAKQQMGGIEAEEILLHPISASVGTLDDAGIDFEKQFTEAFLKLPKDNSFRRFATSLAKLRHKDKMTDELAAAEALNFLNHHLLTGIRPDLSGQSHRIKLSGDEMAALEIFMREREQHPTRRRLLQVGAAAAMIGSLGIMAADISRRKARKKDDPVEYPGDNASDAKKLEWANDVTDSLEKIDKTIKDITRGVEQADKKMGHVGSSLDSCGNIMILSIASISMLVLSKVLEAQDYPDTVLNKAALLFDTAVKNHSQQQAQAR